jgi:phosphoserine phosphatase RsbU/P
MATVSNEVFQDQLELRRQKLLALSPADETKGEVAVLLQEIDHALERLQKGTFGICEECKGGIEADALIANPTLRICLDHFTSSQRRTLEHDLELAHQIQHRLLPQNGQSLHGWEIHYHYQPANLVSGDYCDLIFPQDARDETIFLLGDVSGKGVAAAMLMTQLHAMFRTLGSLGLPLNRLLASANQVLGQSNLSGQFATLIAGRANACGSIEIAGAGHVPALLVSEKA